MKKHAASSKALYPKHLLPCVYCRRVPSLTQSSPTQDIPVSGSAWVCSISTHTRPAFHREGYILTARRTYPSAVKMIFYLLLLVLKMFSASVSAFI